MLALMPSMRKRDERQQDRHRHGDERDNSAGEMPEEDEDDQGNRDDDLENGDSDVVDGAVNQGRPVIDRNDLDAGWKSSPPSLSASTSHDR